MLFFFWRKGIAFLQVMDRNENIGKVAVHSDKSAVWACLAVFLIL